MAENKFSCGGSVASREAIGIESGRILDACRDRDCFEDIRVYLSAFGEDLIARTGNVRVKSARICGANIVTEPEQVRASAAIGAAMIELHTGRFANTLGEERATETARLVAAATLAHELGLEVHAGHGIQLANLAELNAVPHLTELNIGHTIISRAIFIGLSNAVREMKDAIATYQW